MTNSDGITPASQHRARSTTARFDVRLPMRAALVADDPFLHEVSRPYRPLDRDRIRAQLIRMRKDLDVDSRGEKTRTSRAMETGVPPIALIRRITAGFYAFLGFLHADEIAARAQDMVDGLREPSRRDAEEVVLA